MAKSVYSVKITREELDSEKSGEILAKAVKETQWKNKDLLVVMLEVKEQDILKLPPNHVILPEYTSLCKDIIELEVKPYKFAGTASLVEDNDKNICYIPFVFGK